MEWSGFYIDSGGARREQTGRGGLAVLLARGSATLEHGRLGSGPSCLLSAAARCLACPARQLAPAQALPKSLRQRRVLARQRVGPWSFTAGRTCAGAKLGSQQGPVPACSAHGESRAHLSVAPRELPQTSFFIGANRPCARLAPARLHASRRARACLQPAAVFISDSAARDLAGLRARCAAVRSRALSLRALSPPVAGAPPHWAGQPWACPQATAMRL